MKKLSTQINKQLQKKRLKNQDHNIGIKSKTIAIVGVDGSGKSSCFTLLYDSLNHDGVAAIGDTVCVKIKGRKIRPKLLGVKIKTFLGYKVKRLKNRKLYRFVKFIELLVRVKLLKKIDKKYTPGILLTDGSPLINILGWGHYYCPDIYNEGLVKEVIQYMLGQKIPRSRRPFFKKHAKEMLIMKRLRVKFHVPDLVFFLKVSPNIAVDRINKRNECLQVHETTDFLRKLQESYSMVCKLLPNSKVYAINTDRKDIGTVIAEIIKNVSNQKLENIAYQLI